MSDMDREMECAEFVLGTLPLAERAALQREMETDAQLRDAVLRWENWLSGLNDVVPAVEPNPEIWRRIEQHLRPEPASPVVDTTLALRRSRARWRAATLAFGAIAAALALFVSAERLKPQPASYLAVINRSGDLPALIVRVDTGSETVTVRSLAAEKPADRVLELWYVAAGQAPRSMGVVDHPETRAALPAAARAASLAGATLAVSVEPPGGSTTGAPTGPVVYSGKLIRDQ
ncbi:MAG: anti-sigma factor [Acetobacteraceae bacterium]|nr:anti-sigma factor [Acetobacteraceae bacterium]